MGSGSILKPVGSCRSALIMASPRWFSLASLLLVSCATLAYAEVELLKIVDQDLLKQVFAKSPQIKDAVQRKLFGIGKSNRAELELDCNTCELLITLMFSFLEQGSEEEVENALIGLCQDLQIVADDVCAGTLHLEFPAVHYILTNRPISVDDVCGFLLQNHGCDPMNETLTSWTVNIDQTKPTVVDAPLLPGDLPTAKVLHLTDIHPDLHYSHGSLTDCGKPLCCRFGDTYEEPGNSTEVAGEFGDYMCDLPLNAMQNLFLDAAARYEYKFVMLGGDYVHHQIWNTTQEDNLVHYQAVADTVLGAFPDTPVYPVVGNHEPHPVNLFPPTSVWGTGLGFDNSWVYNTLADQFESQLPAEALVTFRKAGYYTVTPEPGFRLVVLNTNLCYILNFWLLYEPVDPEGQLQWFADTMLQAETAGERVFILGHVPPGSEECWSVWNTQFSAIVDRFEAIIMAQFYGHTHFDDFKVFFAEGEDAVRPNNALYIGTSATAYTDLNPGYKVFHVDAAGPTEATWEIVDTESFIYNLTASNLDGAPTWFKLYGAKEAYGLTSLRPQHLYDFVIRMAENEELFQSFYNHFHKDADTILPCTDEEECRRGYLCDLLTSNDSDKSHCSVIDEIIPRPVTTTESALEK